MLRTYTTSTLLVTLQPSAWMVNNSLAIGLCDAAVSQWFRRIPKFEYAFDGFRVAFRVIWGTRVRAESQNPLATLWLTSTGGGAGTASLRRRELARDLTVVPLAYPQSQFPPNA